MVNASLLRTVGLSRSWLTALARRRAGRLAATAIGVALAVGLLASLGTFLSASKAVMTQRAIDTVAVDWQIETQPGADPAAVASDVAANPRRIVASETVSFATTAGSESTKSGTTQTTGPGQVLGVSPRYRETFAHPVPRSHRRQRRSAAVPADRRQPLCPTR